MADFPVTPTDTIYSQDADRITSAGLESPPFDNSHLNAAYASLSGDHLGDNTSDTSSIRTDESVDITIILGAEVPGLKETYERVFSLVIMASLSGFRKQEWKRLWMIDDIRRGQGLEPLYCIERLQRMPLTVDGHEIGHVSNMRPSEILFILRHRNYLDVIRDQYLRVNNVYPRRVDGVFFQALVIASYANLTGIPGASLPSELSFQVHHNRKRCSASTASTFSSLGSIIGNNEAQPTISYVLYPDSGADFAERIDTSDDLLEDTDGDYDDSERTPGPSTPLETPLLHATVPPEVLSITSGTTRAASSPSYTLPPVPPSGPGLTPSSAFASGPRSGLSTGVSSSATLSPTASSTPRMVSSSATLHLAASSGPPTHLPDWKTSAKKLPRTSSFFGGIRKIGVKIMQAQWTLNLPRVSKPEPLPVSQVLGATLPESGPSSANVAAAYPPLTPIYKGHPAPDGPLPHTRLVPFTPRGVSERFDVHQEEVIGDWVPLRYRSVPPGGARTGASGPSAGRSAGEYPRLGLGGAAAS